ncbi:TPA: hypothetical protein UZ441_004890 [Escherichia coli]|nr:hypothetical protein [Escherichia coli]HEL8044759.1 hypothetical protein [Escherichia coli]HEL8049521.1 hypothetical protein [Escherichia coli]HEL8054299.1 hypothetical protein [Escherichia coli]HEL8059135.1 hypothetical protein [Escherichia coli]
MSERNTIQIKISLTPEEYELLKELSALEGKPMAGYFMQFVRQAHMFETLEKVLKTVRKLHAFKDALSSGIKKAGKLI